MKSKAFFVFFFLSAIFTAPALHAASTDVQKSTQPLGSSFYRHLAFDLNWDIKKLHRYELRGFGRGEIITLMLISKESGTPLKDLGNRRLKNESTLEEMAEEAGLDYVTLYKTVRVIKESIEKKGEDNLPPPVFSEKSSEEETAEEAYLKKQKDIE